ncbi:MAG: hypothetical protein GY870_13460, partial [archaeon]|nr:hypothetical protein [archaeon]
LVLDHFASDSIKNHLDAHLGEGEKYFKRHFGKTLRAFFTDSLELSAEWLWTNKFLEEFKKRRGYDITPYLPVCYIPNRDNKYLLIFLGIGVPSFEFKEGLGKRIRYDYENTISDLFCDEYVQTMANWAKNHNIKSRIQAYGIRADVLKAYGISHIPETEQLYAGGSIDFLKFAGSAAAIYEKPLVTAESLVWNRRDYLTTPLKWKVGADRLFISGINEMIYHGFPYNNPAFSYPGFHGFSTRNLPRMVCFSSNMGRMNPFWKFFPIMNSYITRCQYTLQRGKTVSKIGIYYPLFNYCDSTLKLEELTGGVLDEFDLNLEGKTTGGSLKKIEKFDEDEQWTYSQIKISDNLMENGHFYVHVNEDSLLKANLEGKILHVGICKLEVLIFHNIESITLELSQKLENLVKAGFPVVFINKIPDSQPGFYNYRESEEKIRDIFNNEIKDKIFFIQDSLEVGKYISEELKIEPQVIFENSQPTIHYIHKKTETSEIYFLRHSKNTPHKITAKFKHIGKVPYIYDPWNGKMAQKGQYKIEEEYISMELYFDAYGSIILEFKDGEEEIYLEETSIQVDREDGKLTGYISQPGEYLFNLSNGDQKIIEVDNGELIPPLTVYNWNFEAQIREYTGETRSIRMNLDQIRDWREISELKYCSAKGIYKTTINLDSKYFNNDSEKTSRLILSLGRLGDVAELKINDEELQPIMQYPFETDITDYVKEGDNDLKITVTPT